jgi:alginate O-acetyltransferase complex protein AlgI
MLFTSHQFLFVFLPLALLATYFASKYLSTTAAIYVMIAASILFYYFNGLAQLPVLLFSVFVNHCLIVLWLQIKNPKLKPWIIALAITLNLCALAYYKYYIFALQQYEVLTSVIPWNVESKYWAGYISFYYALYPWGKAGEMIILPLGLSFFTFQQIAYLADLQAGRVKEHNLLNYAFCVTFFPHLVAGPIVNYRELIPQLQNKKIFGFSALDLSAGAAIFIIGMAKKALIADTLAGYVGPGFEAAGRGEITTFAQAWLSALAYTFQLYFDFSGYSDMAVGLARMFGVQLPMNFYSPYKSTSVIDFWRRWHITLSRFLRQYLYIPLGGNRGGSFRRYFNLFLTMLIGGLWHGAAWTFVFWGGLHGFYLIINHLWRKMTLKYPSLARFMPTWLAWFITFLAVVIAWVFFRASHFPAAVYLLRAMFRPDLANLGFAALKWQHGLVVVAALIAFFGPASHEIMARYRTGILPDWMANRKFAWLTWRHTLPWLAATAALGGVTVFYETEFPQFLYWNF